MSIDHTYPEQVEELIEQSTVLKFAKEIRRQQARIELFLIWGIWVPESEDEQEKV